MNKKEYYSDRRRKQTIKFKPGHAGAHPQYRIVNGGPLHPRNKELEPKVNKLNKLEK